MPVTADRLLQATARRIEAHFAAMVEAGERAAQPICRERRLLRRFATFTFISCAIWLTAAWYTNRITYYWWKVAIARHGVGEVSSLASSPAYVRSAARLENIQRAYAALDNAIPLSMAIIFRPLFAAAETYVGWVDAARFLALVSAINIGVYLATWSPSGEFFVSRYIIHCGLSGQTYTVFTAVFAHSALYHLLSNLFGLFMSLRASISLSESGPGQASWDYTVPKLLAFYTIAGGFGSFLPNILGLIFAQDQVAKLPQGTTTQTTLPSHTGLREGLGASSAIWALGSLWMLSDPASVTIGGFTIRTRDIIIPSLLIDLPITRYLPIGILQHMSGALFGALYYYLCPSIWELSLTFVGNRRTQFQRQLVDTVLSDGRTVPSYHLIVSDSPLRFGDYASHLTSQK